MVETVGFGFRPTDDELVGYYLQKKIMGMTWLVEEIITEINIYNFDPWDLRFQSKLKPRYPIWYFFGANETKYDNDVRQNRKTSSGFWKITGKSVEIKDRWGIWSGNRGTICYKKCLVFHKGLNPNIGGREWVMQEYHLTILPENQRTHVIYRVEYTGDDISFISDYAIKPKLAFVHDICSGVYIGEGGARKESQEKEDTKGGK